MFNYHIKCSVTIKFKDEETKEVPRSHSDLPKQSSGEKFETFKEEVKTIRRNPDATSDKTETDEKDSTKVVIHTAETTKETVGRLA